MLVSISIVKSKVKMKFVCDNLRSELLSGIMCSHPKIKQLSNVLIANKLLFDFCLSIHLEISFHAVNDIISCLLISHLPKKSCVNGSYDHNVENGTLNFAKKQDNYRINIFMHK